MTEQPSTRRQFKVLKDNGEVWDMNFTTAGVRWERGGGSFTDPATVRAGGPSITGLINPLAAVGAVLDGAASIGMWWESRQRRLMDEASNEESRRSAWLEEMIGRWAEAHRDGDQLDLRVSEYLAREARDLMNVIAANKRVALPQSTLYELDIIQDTLRSFRLLMLEQFETLASNSELRVNAAVAAAVPGGRLSMDYIRELAADPAVEWAQRVKSRDTADFDRELADVTRFPGTFLNRLFPSPLAESPNDTGESQASRVFAVLTALVIPSFPRIPLPELKSDATEKRDAFRELALLPSEVARVKALHTAWSATSAIVTAQLGHDLQVRVSDEGVALTLSPEPARFALTELRATSVGHSRF